jgi:hypothetical protein
MQVMNLSTSISTRDFTATQFESEENLSFIVARSKTCYWQLAISFEYDSILELSRG